MTSWRPWCGLTLVIMIRIGIIRHQFWDWQPASSNRPKVDVWPVTTRLSASVNICPQTFVKELLTTCLCVTLSHRCQTMCHWKTLFIKKRTNPTHSPPTACPKTAPGLFKLSPFSNFPVPSSKNCTAKGLQPKTLQVDLTAPDSDCLTRNCFGIGAGAFRSFLRPGVAVPAHSCTTSYIRGRASSSELRQTSDLSWFCTFCIAIIALLPTDNGWRSFRHWILLPLWIWLIQMDSMAWMWFLMHQLYLTDSDWVKWE